MSALRSLTLPIALLSLSSCGFHGPEMKGIVEEVVNFDAPPAQWKYVPIANAEVMVLWRGQSATPVHSSSVCLRAIYTRSGPDGRFTVPGWWRMPRGAPVLDVHPVSYAFVPGFQQVYAQIETGREWMPGSGVHVMRRPKPGELPTLREDVFSGAQWCPADRDANERQPAAVASLPPSEPPVHPPQVATSCPLICLKLEYGGGCIGGCVAPASSTTLATIDGKQVEVGFWIRGSGGDETHGSDLQFETLVRQPTPGGSIECSFTIDGTISGNRTQSCREPLGSVDITVEEQ